MASYFSAITDEQAELIRRSSVFFVATAQPDLSSGPDGAGPINLSPKGSVQLHVLNSNHVAFLDYLGSGNETARHSREGSPVTLMVCSFEEDNAAIVRLYGKAQVTPLAESSLARLLLQDEAEDLKSSPRQVIEIQVEKTMTSCGYGVPVMRFVRNRRTVDRGRRYKAYAK